jgi:hypothetical protein
MLTLNFIINLILSLNKRLLKDKLINSISLSTYIFSFTNEY